MATAKKSAKRATKSTNTKTAANRRHIKGADTKKTPGKKSAAKKGGKKTSAANACWPGYEPVPGKMQGEKGSCEPKKNQTAAERKGDQKAAAAARLSGQRK
ncbi:hypothetical protein [Terriglobus roseus]|uniref:Uncharacterized protein n=1 Tax=Terriglobus roseus TaxID=392734 RepID=A0A1G7Q1F3_9BACT|nr:hypothetical protein [Terriglobus roseus]SDF91749.1 hypothetical protein SAMN05444167_3689 [Terriglobus roseus]